MKNDPVISSVINFLLPVIFLYSCFFLIGFSDSGFFAFIYSLVLFVSGLIVFYIARIDIKLFTKINFNNIALFVVLISLIYLAVLLISITGGFSI